MVCSKGVPSEMAKWFNGSVPLKSINHCINYLAAKLGNSTAMKTF